MSAQPIPMPASALFAFDSTVGDGGESFSFVAVEAHTQQYGEEGRADATVILSAHDDGEGGERVQLQMTIDQHLQPLQAEVFDSLSPSDVLALAKALGVAIARAQRIGMLPLAVEA